MVRCWSGRPGCFEHLGWPLPIAVALKVTYGLFVVNRIVTKSAIMLTPSQCRAARGLLGWSQDELIDATTGKLAKRSLIRFEAGDTSPRDATAQAIQLALEAAGVVFLADGEMVEGGPGVRLKSR
jgi:hypothetical protein